MGFDLDSLLRALGRAHPIAVHFPIALLLSAATLELLAAVRRKQSPSGLACLTLGALSAIPAATIGWFNAEFEKHGSSTAGILFWHRWLGIGLAAAAVGALVLGIVSRRRARAIPAYRLLLVAIVPAVVWVGHLGGTMVYGEGYLLEPFREARKSKGDATQPVPVQIAGEPAEVGRIADDPDEASRDAELPAIPIEGSPAASLVDFRSQVLPIFEARCVECHGPRKQKGKLRLDSAAAVLSRVDSGVIVPGDPDTSALVVRVELDVTEDDAMPPEGDRLTAEQIAIIRAWIAEGALAGDAGAASEGESAEAPKLSTPGVLNDGATAASSSIQMAPDDAIAEEAATPARALTPAELAVIGAIEARGGIVSRVAVDRPELEVNFALMPPERGVVVDADLALLAGLEDCLVGLNLGGSAITDAGVARLAEFPRLRKLWLDRTAVGDDAMTPVAGLEHLKYLNLYGTGVGDLGLARLHGMKSLRNVYVWRSKATRRGVSDLYESLTGVRIELGE